MAESSQPEEVTYCPDDMRSTAARCWYPIKCSRSSAARSRGSLLCGLTATVIPEGLSALITVMLAISVLCHGPGIAHTAAVELTFTFRSRRCLVVSTAAILTPHHRVNARTNGAAASLTKYAWMCPASEVAGYARDTCSDFYVRFIVLSARCARYPRYHTQLNARHDYLSHDVLVQAYLVPLRGGAAETVYNIVGSRIVQDSPTSAGHGLPWRTPVVESVSSTFSMLS